MKIAVGLSGGVDSSVTAALLKEQGHDVHAVFMKNWSEEGEQCTIKKDWQDAQAIAQSLQIPITMVDFSKEYWDHVFEFFLSELEKNRTPSPDILCNQHVKFGVFLQWAIKEGYDAIATGHYAALSPEKELMQPKDLHKDQTYFLWSVPSQLWARVYFPLGTLEKKEVRALAESRALITADKKDSTGVCFIGPKHFKSFIKRYLLTEKGPICDDQGRILGYHDGLFGVTLGQRSGLQIGGVKNAKEAPWYVVEKQQKTNTIIVSQNKEDHRIWGRTLRAESCVWQKAHDPSQQLCARIRHGQILQACSISLTDPFTVDVCFDTPQFAIAPGQAIVFYQAGYCIGGGWIA